MCLEVFFGEKHERQARPPKANQAYHFLKYADKVYKLGRSLESLLDGRKWAPVPLESGSALGNPGVVCGLGSLNQIEVAVRNGGFDKVLGHMKERPSADTIGYALKRMDAEELRKYNSVIIQKARYNKVFSKETVDGLVVAGIDGTESIRPRLKAEVVHGAA